MSTIVKERSNVLNVEVSRRNDRNVDRRNGNNKNIELKRGDLVFIDLPTTSGSVQSGSRVCLVLSNNMNNMHSSTINIAPLTSKMGKHNLPVHVLLKANETNNLKCDSLVLLEQVQTVSKENIKFFTGRLNEEEMAKVNKAMMIQLGLM